MTTNPPIPPSDPTAKFAQPPLPIFVSIINELNTNNDQLLKRQALLREIEALLTAKYAAGNRIMSYVLRFAHAKTFMGSTDFPSFDAILNSISGAEQINLLMHTPGGDGTVIEKMVDMCRSHLTGANKKLRVIVPNIVKSAGTVLALGADSILMGYCSELGPIDPQVPIAVNGMIQQVSAFSFIDARDNLMDAIIKAKKKKEPIDGFLQQLAGLNIPFIQEMANWISFSEKVAGTLLDKYMLPSKFSNATARKKKAKEIATKLLSKQVFPVHGQFIDGATAQALGVEVELLDKADVLWQKLWEYYIRCEVQMNIPLQPPFIKTKLFESSSASLVTQDTVN